MGTHELKPSSRYLLKLLLVIAIIAALVLIAAAIVAGGIASEEGAEDGFGFFFLVFALNGLWFVPALLMTVYYYRSLRYEILDDEVIVYAGIWTKSVKHVPFRTVTNIKTNRDIFDRWFFNLGSLNIQTAGMSGQSGAEESLVGLPNVEEIYGIVGNRLRRYRGAMSPTGGGEEPVGASDTFGAILGELQAIRRAVEK